jgi:hypothetical protein
MMRSQVHGPALADPRPGAGVELGSCSITDSRRRRSCDGIFIELSASQSRLPGVEAANCLVWVDRNLKKLGLAIHNMTSSPTFPFAPQHLPLIRSVLRFLGRLAIAGIARADRDPAGYTTDQKDLTRATIHRHAPRLCLSGPSRLF